MTWLTILASPLFRYAIGAALLAGAVWWGYSTVKESGRNEIRREWAEEQAKANLKLLKAEAERDEYARKLGEQTQKDLARSLASIEVRRTETIERIRPLLPASDPTECSIPDGVWDEIDKAHDRAQSAIGDDL